MIIVTLAIAACVCSFCSGFAGGRLYERMHK